ncbi:RHNO1 protein, partial [Atlantisia rogersi]|nr:RHNO1 protein [Atlantisia rogersi]
MPRKKKCTHKARMAELVFLERPREGPVHCYETLLPSAENPRRVPTKPVDQNASAAWVCPQFETTTSVVVKPRQKQHCGPHNPQNQDASHSVLQAGGACRRAVACRFSPLTFENPEGRAVPPLDRPNGLRKNTAAKSDIQAKSPENCRALLPVPQPVGPQVSSPPDVEIPQVPSTGNWECSGALPQTGSPACHPKKALALDTGPCEGEEAAAVLVADTPKHQYGVKVTWRRRARLMEYLLERG